MDADVPIRVAEARGDVFALFCTAFFATVFEVFPAAFLAALRAAFFAVRGAAFRAAVLLAAFLTADRPDFCVAFRAPFAAPFRCVAIRSSWFEASGSNREIATQRA
jgi:small-conductance mechanosensitive channel